MIDLLLRSIALSPVALPRHILTDKCRDLLGAGLGDFGGVVDASDEGGAPVAHDVEGVDCHRQVLPVPMMLRTLAVMVLAAEADSPLRCLLYLSSVGVGLAAVGQVKHVVGVLGAAGLLRVPVTLMVTSLGTTVVLIVSPTQIRRVV